MKKILLFVLLMGLVGCGDDGSSNPSKNSATNSNDQALEARPLSALSAPFNGWSLSNPTAFGASTIYDGAKGGMTSFAPVTPNASQVAKILRGGAAGIALSLAVDQILGAVDWVMDPANNRILYREGSSSCLADHSCVPPDALNYYYFYGPGYVLRKYPNPLSACNGVRSAYGGLPIISTDFDVDNLGPLYKCVVNGNGAYQYIVRSAVNNDRKELSFDVIAEQVLSNANEDNVDAQVATMAAAAQIISEAENDEAKAQPIVEDLENNANKNCEAHNSAMNYQADQVESRYNEMYIDRYDLYLNHRPITNPFIDEYGDNKGSWDGHAIKYKTVQRLLNTLIVDALVDGCQETPKAGVWKKKAHPPKPGVHS